MPTVAPLAAETPLALAIDLGTSSVRALAADRLGRFVEGTETQLPYQVRASADGGVEADAAVLFGLMTECIDGTLGLLGRRAADVGVVGMTSFWHALMGMDAAGEPCTPVYYWADTRSGDDATALRHEHDEAGLLDRTGCRFHSSYWPAKLRWLRRTDPGTFRRSARWVSFTEYALARLCGAGGPGVSVSMASGTGLLDVHRLGWDAEALAISGIGPERLSALADLAPGGRLAAEWARRWPALAGAPWIPALGDGACANVGSGAVDPARVALTVGTSGAIRLVFAPESPDWHASPKLWAYRLDRRRAVIGGAVSNGGNVTGWLWRLLGLTPESAEMEAAAALAPDSHGLTVLPFLAGERSPAWHDDATGVVAGLTLATGPDHLIRSFMEAASLRLAMLYDDLRPFAAPEHQVVANGGAILQSPMWLQITADALGRPLTAMPPDDEATARGAAAMALTAAGIVPSLADLPDPAAGARVIEPDPGRHAAYRAAMERQGQLESLLFRRESSWDGTGG
ncbi:MAG: gluconokinase [Chloroflexota bacterium]